MKHYDAIVIGAGPAGSSLALHLARQGRSVALIDGARFPRRKVCGEGLMPHGLQALRALGLEPRGAPFSGLRYVLGAGARAEARFPAGLEGLGVERAWLDFQLVRLAEAEPRIDLRLGTWVQKIELPRPGAPRAGEPGGDEVAVHLGGEVLRGAVLIGADGGRSRVRTLAGLDAPAPRRARYGIATHIARGVDPCVEVALGAGCEIYTTPVGQDLTCVALLTDRHGLATLQGDLAGGLRRQLQRCGGRGAALAEAPFEEAPRALGPLALQATRAHGERLLLVGDAAGALDPITGEGVSLALATSQIASEVLAEAFASGDFSARALASWTRRRARALRGLAGFTRAILYLAEHPARAERVVRTLAEAPDTFERLLGVAVGNAPLTSLRLRDGVRLLLG